MIFSQMVTLFYDKIRESSTNSAFTEAKVKKWINEGYRHFLNYRLWGFLFKEESTTNIFTHCSDGGTSNGTTLYVDSTDGMQAGMKIYVTDGVNFERVEISSVNAPAGTVTLSSPGLIGSYKDGDTVSGSQVFLPADCRKLLEIRRDAVSASVQEGQALKYCDPREFDITVSYIKSMAPPTHYMGGGIDVTSDGYITNHTAGTGTGTSEIVFSSTTGKSDDYYKGWRVVNTTRKESARVTAFDSATEKLTISTPIANQVPTDNFYLIRDLGRIFLYPLPDQAYTITFHYYRNVNDMVNDGDIPLLGPVEENAVELIVDYALAEAGLSDRNLDWSNMYRQKYVNGLEQLKLQDIDGPDRVSNMLPTRYSRLPGFYL